MCCLTKLLTAFLQSISLIMAVFAFLVVTFFFIKMIYKLIFPSQKKHSDGYQEQWFAREPKPLTDDAMSNDTSIRPFKIDVPEDVLSDLKSRLERTRFEDPVENSKFYYGFNPNCLRKVVDYWKKEYDWRQQERTLNQFPHFKTRIEGIDIHFIHVKPDLPADSKLKVLPLLIIHGWPGSVVEFYKIIPMLTNPRQNCDFVFEVICPSIPGFGFSESPHRKGFNARSAARVFLTLMERIGHHKFYVQGGDWGSAIAHIMARYYSPKVKGLHMNMYFNGLKSWEAIKYLIINYLPFLVSKTEYKIGFPISKLFKMFYAEGAYFHMQSTKPDTLGASMSDSPAGMAAYLLEKFSGATNPECIHLEDGGLTKKFTMDELLTNVMLYWVNNNFTAAARFYKENLMAILSRQHGRVPVTVPTAIAVFPNEVLMLPKMCMSQQIKNIVSYKIMPRGGHFAAMEEPELLADDVWNFVSLVEK